MKQPEFGEALPACNPNNETIALLWRRRSTPADFLTDPGPDPDALGKILTIAARVPDHRRVTPFRFIVFQGASRATFGDALAAAYTAQNPDADAEMVAKQRGRFLRAPTVVGVVSKVDPAHRTPEWEQILTAGAVCQNMLIACSAFGFAAQWLTEWYSYDDDVRRTLDLTDCERLAGFIYIGTATEPPLERARPVVADIVTRFPA